MSAKTKLYPFNITCVGVGKNRVSEKEMFLQVCICVESLYFSTTQRR